MLSLALCVLLSSLSLLLSLTATDCETCEPEAIRQSERPAESVDTASERCYGGLTLEEWRRRLKDLDPQNPQSMAAIPALIALIQDSEVPWFSRRQAALLLGQMGSPAQSAVPVLIDLLDRESEAEVPPRTWAVKALAAFGPAARPAVPKLIELLEDETLPLSDRLAPLEGLMQIGTAHPEVVPALIRTLQYQPGEDSPVAENAAAALRAAAAEAIAWMGSDASAAVPALIRTARDERERVRRLSIRALGAIGPRADIALPTVVDSLVFDSSEAVRDEAAESLSQLGPRAAPTLQHLLDDQDAGVRWRAAASLGKVSPPVPGTIKALQAALQDRVALVRLCAAESLWGLHQEPETVISTLVSEFTAEDRQIRMRAFKLLTAMGTAARGAIEPLQRLQQDERPYVRRAAGEALRRLKAAE